MASPLKGGILLSDLGCLFVEDFVLGDPLHHGFWLNFQAISLCCAELQSLFATLSIRIDLKVDQKAGIENEEIQFVEKHLRLNLFLSFIPNNQCGHFNPGPLVCKADDAIPVLSNVL